MSGMQNFRCCLAIPTAGVSVSAQIKAGLYSFCAIPTIYAVPEERGMWWLDAGVQPPAIAGIFRSRLPPRHHPRNKCRYPLRIMLPGSSFQSIRTFECLGTEDLHLPPVIRLRADGRNPPVPGPIRKHMFDDRSYLCQTRISRVLHLHRNCHTARKYHHASHSRKPRATRARILPQSRPRRSMSGAYGDTGCSPRYDSQTRKPQLGASYPARSRSPY